MDKAFVKITYTDGSVSYMKEGGIVVSDKEYATEYQLRVAKGIVSRSHNWLGEKYEVEVIK